MNIQTKFEIGQNVHFIHNNKAKEARVDRVEIEAFKRLEGSTVVDISYKLKEGVGHRQSDINDISEDALFATKDDLRASL